MREAVYGKGIPLDVIQDSGKLIRSAIESYIAATSANRLKAFGDAPIFDKPLVGYADGDDPVFTEFKRVVGESHMTPREAMERYLSSYGKSGIDLGTLRVISFVMPTSRETRLSMRRESEVPSLRWNHTRWYGQAVIDDLSAFLVYLLEKLGYAAVAPDRTAFFGVVDAPSGRVSNWSHRHIAFAAGLGTFGLSDGFISERGIAMRCGSVVTTMPLPVTERRHVHHMANCLRYRTGSCGRCIKRCPAGAISERGHDKKKCREYVVTGQLEVMKRLGRTEGYLGKYPGCGLCQTKVPCEDRIPPAPRRRPRPVI